MVRPQYGDKDFCYSVTVPRAVIVIVAKSEDDARKKAEIFGGARDVRFMHVAAKHYGNQPPGTREELFKTLAVNML